MSAEKIYISQLTFTRFIAAVLVVTLHFGNEFPPFNIPWLYPIIKNGDSAVSYFFFLSGAVLVVSYWHLDHISFFGFLKKRLARIYPVYFVASLLTAGILFIGSGAVSIKGVLSEILMYESWFPRYNEKINFPSWSISVELFFYCMFPLCLIFFKKKSIYFFIVFVIVLWSVTQYWEFFVGQNIYLFFSNKADGFFFLKEFPVFHFNTFVAGMLAGVLILKLKRKDNVGSTWPLLTWIASVVAIVFVLWLEPTVLKGHLNNGILCPLFFLLTIGLAMDQSRISKLLARKPLVYLGDVSYGFYILQFPLAMLFVKITGYKMNSYSFFAYLAFLLAVSCISYSFFEKKVRSWILKH